jgi:acetyl-CoA decarbonylase/synthase complex subunit alpha
VEEKQSNPVATGEQYVVPLGRLKVDLRKIVRDLRGIEDQVRWIVQNDWQETRWSQFKQRIFPFADAADIAEWDKAHLARTEPVYTSCEDACNDCPQGPCNLSKAKGKCGLTLEAYQAKISLKIACRGCLSQVKASRELLTYALKVFGRDKELVLGKSTYVDETDMTTAGCFTAQTYHHRPLSELERTQAYVEEQLTKLMLASQFGVGSVEDFEEMVFHAGSILLAAQTVAELIKTNCFGFPNAADNEQVVNINFPPPTTIVGLGSLEREKPAIMIIGDDFLPGWVATELLKKEGLTEKIELCGVGPAADDGIRFSDHFRNLGPILQATKIIRSGIADVIIASTACINLDILDAARRTETRVIWTGKEQSLGLPDRIDDPVEDIVKDLIGGAEGVWIRDPEKAAEVAVKAVQQIRGKRKGNYVLSEERVKAEATKCQEGCDLCFTVCPNSLLLNKAVKAARTEGVKALAQVEKACFLCGKCEESCPGNVALLDLMVAAQEVRAPQEKFEMRAGRGPVTRQEAVTMAYALAGNISGFVYILGCGGADPDELAWMANEMTKGGFGTGVAGCAGTQVARYYDEVEQKFVFRKYPSEVNAKNLLNCGACSATHHLHDWVPKWVRTGTFVSHYGNFAETMDVMYPLWLGATIIWGANVERMYAIAAALARAGHPVVVGPASEWGWKRFLLGDKWDWRKWWIYDILEKRRRITEPAKKHLIIPVETKEEAITMAKGCIFYCSSVADTQVPHLELYLEWSDTFFGEFPDDWYKYIRGPLEFPLRFKARMIKDLGEKYGWETGRMVVTKARHPDGRLMTFDEFRREYSASDGRGTTFLPHRLRERKLEPGEVG